MTTYELENDIKAELASLRMNGQSTGPRVTDEPITVSALDELSAAVHSLIKAYRDLMKQNHVLREAVKQREAKDMEIMHALASQIRETTNPSTAGY